MNTHRTLRLLMIGVLTWSLTSLIGMADMRYPTLFFLGAGFYLGMDFLRHILLQRKAALPIGDVLELMDRDVRWLSALREFDADPQ